MQCLSTQSWKQTLGIIHFYSYHKVNQKIRYYATSIQISGSGRILKLLSDTSLDWFQSEWVSDTEFVICCKSGYHYVSCQCPVLQQTVSERFWLSGGLEEWLPELLYSVPQLYPMICTLMSSFFRLTCWFWLFLFVCAFCVFLKLRPI